jgi:hypothetical protein
MIPFILFTTLQNKNLMFYVFCYFQGPIQSQMDLGFFENQYFTTTEGICSFEIMQTEPGGPKGCM